MTRSGVLLLLGICAMAAADNKFIMTLPNEIRPNMRLNGSLLLLFDAPAGSSMKLSARTTVTPTSDLLWAGSEKTIVLASGKKLYEIDLGMAPSNLYSGAVHYIHYSFTEIKGLTDPGLKTLSVVRPRTPIIATTDKGIYKANETVQIVVANIDKMLRPDTRLYSIMIKDPNNNILMKEVMDPADASYKSLRKMSFQLAEEPILGTYSIAVEGDNSYTEVTFIVEEYVLPKFDVKIDVDKSYIYPGAGNTYENVRVDGKVTSMYTYGQRVVGSLKLYINNILMEERDKDSIKAALTSLGKQGKSPVLEEFLDIHKKQDQTVIEQKAAVSLIESEKNLFHKGCLLKIDGHYDFSLALPNKAKMYTFRAEVYEQQTDIMANGSVSIPMLSSKEKTEIVKPIPPRFSTDRTYMFKAVLKDGLGGSLSPNHNLTGYKLTYCVNYNPVCADIDVTSNPQEVTIPSTVDDVKTEFRAPIKVHFHRGVEISMPATFTAVLYDTYSNQPLYVQLVDSPNQDVCFTATPCGNSDEVYFQIVNNFYQEPMQPYSCAAGIACVTPGPMHAPVSMILVYKVQPYQDSASRTTKEELLTASVRFTKPFATEQQVSLSVNPSTAKPKDKVNIQVQTRGKAFAVVTAVDVSIELLAKANDLTNNQLEEIYTYARLFERKKANPYPNPPELMPRPIAIIERQKRSICFRCGDYFSNINAEKILEDAGTTFVTNLEVYSSGGQEKESSGAVEIDDTAESEPAAEVRQNFPETWMMNVIETDNNGMSLIEETVPDTMTSWNLKVWALNANYGIGVGETQKLTVFQDFFLSMNLPYSVVRNEKFKLQLLVFNYKPSAIDVMVQLKPRDSHFSVVPGPTQDIIDLLNQRLTVLPGEAAMAEVPITPTKVSEDAADWYFEATAYEINNQTNRDTVKRNLIVKYEGIEMSESQELKPHSLANGEVMEKTINPADIISTSFENIVQGSTRLFVHVTGDMMGPFIKNLEGKIRMPYGCGEQNIKSLSPSIFVAMYLKSVNRFDAESKRKCQKYSGIGLTRQMSYMHANGGFSAFGDRSGLCGCLGGSSTSTPASTWLTGFVLKVFSQLAQEDLTYVSRVTLQKAFQFLKAAMSPDDSVSLFVEAGNVIHQEMTGGTSAGTGLTSSVLLALLNLRDVAIMDGNDVLLADLNEVIQTGLTWLRNKKLEMEMKKRPYYLALAACTLAKGATSFDDENFQNAKDMLMMFEANKDVTVAPPMECPMMAKRMGPCKETRDECRSDEECRTNELCCSTGCYKQCMTGMQPTVSRYQKGPTKIEMYGYALIAYTMLADKSRAYQTQILEYKNKAAMYADLLISLKKSGGNWITTQDTVLALEALATYASAFPDTTQTQFRVQITDSTNMPTRFEFDADNFLTTQFKSFEGAITIAVTGTSGTAYITVEARYNTFEEITLTPIRVIINTYKTRYGKNMIETCVNNKYENVSLSSMLTVTLNCGTGYVYDGAPTQLVEDAAYDVQRLEADRNDCKVTYYYMKDEGNFIKPRCYKFEVREEFEIENRMAGNVIVRDYYKPENNAELTFAADFSTYERTTTEGPTTGCSHAQISATLLVAMVIAVIATIMQ